MAAARSSLETEVVSIMRSLRERGRLERNALARRLKAGPSADVGRVSDPRRGSYNAGDGNRRAPVAGNLSAER